MPPLQAIFRVLTLNKQATITKVILSAFAFFFEMVLDGQLGWTFEFMIRILAPNFDKQFEKNDHVEATKWFIKNFFPG
jgi:hypothetical protein